MARIIAPPVGLPDGTERQAGRRAGTAIGAIPEPVAAEFVKTFNDRATKAGLPDNAVETQAAASFSAWQILEAAVVGTKGLDDKAMAAWLKKNPVDTIEGRLRFDGRNNFGDDLMRVKQVQDGHWVTVWPKEWAAPGAKLISP